jgi:glycerophosphoryl diester phosphodiesterase
VQQQEELGHGEAPFSAVDRVLLDRLKDEGAPPFSTRDSQLRAVMLPALIERSATKVAAAGFGLTLALLLVTALHSATPTTSARSGPIVIGHRGACGYLPEHTLESYALAHGQGADYIEPDLVRTSDGAFICLHDIYLEPTTDVAAVFPGRARADGRYYAVDFTLEEVRRLRVRERLDRRFPQGASRFAIPTFEEMIELVAGLNRTTGRRAGIYPELKNPAFHSAEGLRMEEAFLAITRRYRLGASDALPIFVQCFEPGPLRELRRLGSSLPQIFLLDDDAAAQVTAAGLDAIAAYADGIGPSKVLIAHDPALVARAHQRGLTVHSWTFRVDDVGKGYATFEDELEAYYRRFEVDGLFTDFPDRARKWLDR